MRRTPKMDWPAFLLFSAILLGALLRFMPAVSTKFPINDGGMFHRMTRDLQANEYRLPDFTSYNALDIPYAYPPLGMYAASLLADLGRIPLLEVFLWLPPILATLIIPAFYLFARALLADRLRAALAALLFALTPGGYGWHIMGGGLTRSFGILFLLFTATQVYLVFAQARRRALLPAILFGALAVLSHPELGLHTAAWCAALWLFFGRSRRGAAQAALVAAGVFLLTAPWWASVLSQHGTTPLLSAARTGLHDSNVWRKFLADGFSSEGLFPFLLLLRWIGAVYALAARRWGILSLIVIPYLADPRAAPSVAVFGFSLAAAPGLLDGCPALVQWLRRREAASTPALETRWGVALLLGLILFLFLDGGFYDYRLVNTTLTADERAAMEWVDANLPAQRNFFLLTGRKTPMNDPAQEWFPALTSQRSQTTLQGLEWLLGAEFSQRLDDLSRLQTCADLACVDDWSARTGLGYDALWLRVPATEDASQPARSLRALAESILASGKFHILYRNDSTLLFERAPKRIFSPPFTHFALISENLK